MTAVSAQPEWSAVDEQTADLLSLVADGPMSGSADHEWDEFVKTLKFVADVCDGTTIPPNYFRRQIRDLVAPRRIGAYTNRALARGLIEGTGDWEISDDTEGRNAGRPCRVYRWVGGAS